jgi:hypothetical protein
VATHIIYVQYVVFEATPDSRINAQPPGYQHWSGTCGMATGPERRPDRPAEQSGHHPQAYTVSMLEIALA